jgi:hypothetical protein
MDNMRRSLDRIEPKGASESAPKVVQIDSAASVALAEAVRSARESAKAPSASAKDATAGASRWASSSKFVAQTAIALLLVGAGWSASYMGTLANKDAILRLETETARSQEMLARLSSDIDAMKGGIAAFNEIEHTSSTASASEQTKLSDKVERLAVSLQEPGKKLSALESRFERMESQVMTTLAALNTKTSAPAAPPTPPVTEAAVREEAAAPKAVRSEPVDGWVLREVYNGAALVESRNRRLYEVMPGGLLPGVGKVEAIERRGTRWVVLTDKGFIGTYR